MRGRQRGVRRTRAHNVTQTENAWESWRRGPTMRRLQEDLVLVLLQQRDRQRGMEGEEREERRRGERGHHSVNQ